MTIAQQLEQKGIEEGIQIGREKGHSEGERDATLKIARTMLQNGLDRDTVRPDRRGTGTNPPLSSTHPPVNPAELSLLTAC